MEGVKKRRLPLVDRLPEHIHYQDSGCAVSSSCLNCPLERCLYDEPVGGRGAAQRARDQEILRRYQELALQSRNGQPASLKRPDIRSLAAHFHLSRRTIHRVVQRMQREEVGANP